MKQHRDRYENQDDATLIASVLAGEREASDILLARYWCGVLRLCTALLGNSFEAQDIAQEASVVSGDKQAVLQELAGTGGGVMVVAVHLLPLSMQNVNCPIFDHHPQQAVWNAEDGLFREDRALSR